MKETLDFKEVHVLPDYDKRKGIFQKTIIAFLDSKVGIGLLNDTSKSGKHPQTSCWNKAIEQLGLSSLMWATSRHKKLYLINIKISGIKRVMKGNSNISLHDNKGKKHLEDLVRSDKK